MNLFDRILQARGLVGDEASDFLSPDYRKTHDPFLLPDMKKAVSRIVKAHKNQEAVVIYGDYDVDGLTASTLLFNALTNFGFKNLSVFIPNRFVDGYGLNSKSIEQLAKDGAHLVITVDCGSTSIKEVDLANKLNLDIVITDHHSVLPDLPNAVAVVNPKRADNIYPFIDLAGVGVAFKLVQALQTKLTGLETGQEKWLLDLVAMGTVCDSVTLVNENRIFVYWGLKVMSKLRRPGVKALLKVAGVDPQKISSRSLGFALGPRLNAAGRLETARLALDLLLSSDNNRAIEIAEKLDQMNQDRRIEQDRIFNEAKIHAEQYVNDPVLVVINQNWSHGIVGIVASKLLETYKKPTIVLENMGEKSKGSGRSFGGFNLVEAINQVRDLLDKGGGHHFAAGVTLPTSSVDEFRKRLNVHYETLGLKNQADLLLPTADAIAAIAEIDFDLIDRLSLLEPFGNGNSEPVLKVENSKVVHVNTMGVNGQHIKFKVMDNDNQMLTFLAFNAPDNYFVEVGDTINIWFSPGVNEWRDSRSIEGRIIHLEKQTLS